MQLSDTLGVTPRYVSKLLNTEYINKELLIQISEILDCNPAYLINDDFGYLPFATYEGWQYDHMYCLRGLLNMKNYNPSDFTSAELIELLHIVGKTIGEYATLRNKSTYNTAFWVPNDDGGSVIEITFDKEEGDADD